MYSLFFLAVVLMVHQSMYPIRMACEVSFTLPYRGCTRPGVMLIGLNFHDIDDMLLRLFYLYEKSLRKCHELSVNNLKEVFELLKVVTYLCELMEVAGLRTSGNLYRELSFDTVLTLTT